MLLNSHPKKRVVLIFTRQWKLLTHVLRMEKNCDTGNPPCIIGEVLRRSARYPAMRE